MSNESQNITLALLLQSLEDDFNPLERARILEILKNAQPSDEALLGAKMILEDNNWDYTVLRTVFNKTTKRIEQLETKRAKTRITYLKYAAALLPLTLLIGYFMTTTFRAKEDISQYYPVEEGLPNLMGPEKTDWDALMELYSAHKMNPAFSVSEGILAQKPQNDTAIYFHGIIGYELKKYKLAQRDFSNMERYKESVFYYDGIFRLGFALKNQNKIKAAQQQFERIAKDSTNPFNQQAKVVLRHCK